MANPSIGLDKIAYTTGRRIYALMVEQGYTLRGLAKQLGVTPAHLSKITKLDYGLSTELLIKIADTLQTSTDYLLVRPGAELAHGELSDEAKSIIGIVEHLPENDRQEALRIVMLLFGKAAETARIEGEIERALNFVEKTRGKEYRDKVSARIMEKFGYLPSA
ncbi:MAG TPA: helix-turn-helix domain-containing protein [Myxococcota bacterium]|nr:helix-turn-helix domain-containing protein [Myxococcota bacterium]HRV18707.1 helix-turn-helix domain-containing protein [Myxococcota bacterium]